MAALCAGTFALAGAAPRPRIVWRPIPFGPARRAQSRRYVFRHYGLRSLRLHPLLIVEHVSESSTFESLYATFSAVAAAAPGGGSATPGALAPFLRRGLPIYCGGAHGHYVALTFDDGPGPLTTYALRLLQRARVRATFFLVGRNLAAWPSLPRREAKLGAVGDHTWTHPSLTRLDRPAIHFQLAHTQAVLERLLASPVSLFRPPYGFHDAAVDREARNLGMLQVLWSLDSHDSYPHGGLDSAGIGAQVASHLHPGSIVLLHENRPQTLAALRIRILPALRKRGLRAISVPELLALDPPSLTQLREGIQGCRGASA